MLDVTKNVVPTTSDSNPTAGAISDGAPANQEGEKAKIISSLMPEAFAAQHTQLANPVVVFNEQVGIFGISDNVGTFKARDLGKIADLLDGSNKLLQKCSLNDIMFLVMLIMTKATSDQRESRYESMLSKKNVSAHTAQMVYSLKMAEAESTYKAEKKQAIMQIVSGAISIVSGLMSCLSCIGGIKIDANIPKMLENFIKFFKKFRFVFDAVDKFANSANSLVSGALTISIAKERKKSEFIRAEADSAKALFEFNMKQISDLNQAYSTSSRNVRSILDTLREALQKNQSTKLSVARNI